MIAAFLKSETGDFDLPAFAMLVFTAFFGGYGLLRLIPKWLRDRRVRFNYSGPYVSKGAEYDFGRDKNPIGFWTSIVLFTLTSIAIITFGVLACFGVFRHWK